ncbi:hypothetical protein GGI20_000239 [Coemansia sp. BCRC 34301]|nr:hypothetical protein GGI20_000239 [Coemansia sp. BCRC 34301]
MAQSKHRQIREAAGQAADSVALILEGLLSSEIRNTLNKSSADICERLQSMASGFEKWVSPNERKAMSEDDIYPKFSQFVLFVMACLKALDPRLPPDNQSRLLLPARKSNFIPGGSTEGYKLDLVLVLHPWDTDIDTIVTIPANTNIVKPQYADIFAVVEAEVGYNPATVKNTVSPTLRQAQTQLVLYNRQIYEHQHNRTFTWGLTVCGSLIRVYHFGPDIIPDLDVRTPVGRKDFVQWLVLLSLAEDFCRGLDPCMAYVGTSDERRRDTHGIDGKEDQGYAEGDCAEDESSGCAEREDSEYVETSTSGPRSTGAKQSEEQERWWEITITAIDGNGATMGKAAVYCSRGPSFAAGSNFGRHTRGFLVSTSQAGIKTPDLFVETAWQFAERAGSLGNGGCSGFLNLSLIKQAFAHDTPATVHIPQLLAGGVATAVVGGKLVRLTTDDIYTEGIRNRHGGVNVSQTTSDMTADATAIETTGSAKSTPQI